MVRIGTWNLENLFRPGPSGPSDDSAYQQKLDSLAKTITSLNPDLLGVQEVGDPEALDDLVGKLSGYTHRATADPDGRGSGSGSCRSCHAHLETESSSSALVGCLKARTAPAR